MNPEEHVYKELYVQSQKQVSELIEMLKQASKQTDELIKMILKLESKIKYNPNEEL
jgi:hypothetical protein